MTTAARSAWIAAAGWAMAGVIAFGPWEFREGIGFLHLQLSLPELLAAFAVCVAGVAMLLNLPNVLGQIRQNRMLYMALCAWALVHLASVFSTPADRGLVLKFALRVTGGVVLAAVACTFAPQPRFRQAFSLGILTSLGLISLLGALERIVGRDFERFLKLFRDEPTWMLGEQRLSTVFYHANTCAVFFELTAPFLIVAAASDRLSKPLRGLAVAGLTGVAVLLSLTYSRAGLISAVSGALVLLVASQLGRKRPILTALSFFYIATVVGAYVTNPDMRARVGLTERSYRAEYTFEAPCAGYGGQTVAVPLEVHNRGEWALSNRQAPGLLMHIWMTPEGKRLAIKWNYELLPDMPQRSRVHLKVPVRLPRKPGVYVLAVDIMRDEVLRISELGNSIAWLRCTSAPDGTDLAPLLAVGPSRTAPDQADEVISSRHLELERRNYWRAALLLWERRMLFGWGDDRFRLSYREYVPFEGYDPRARAHSVLAETAADLGLVGLAVLLFFVFVVARRGLVVIKRGWLPENGPGIAAAAGLAGLAVHSQVDYFLAYTQVTVILWPMIGLLCGANVAQTSQNQTEKHGV